MLNPESLDDSRPAPRPDSRTQGLIFALGIGVILLICLLVIFTDTIAALFATWETEEYSHAFTIPFIALYLSLLRARDVDALEPGGSWLGLVILGLGLCLELIGNFSGVFLIAQYGIVMTITGILVAAAGLGGLRVLWVPIVYLVFMVPFPDFLEQRLTANLQLLSSQIGVAVIQLAGISVYLQGNVIDLGNYKLQVVEACSGLRYLFPLMSFSFLCAVLFRGRSWQRAVLFLSAVPITILMNSFRIGMIGVLVDRYGIEQAEGFMHDFEGWAVFMACVLILFILVAIFARIEKQKFLHIFGLDIPVLADIVHLLGRVRPNPQILAVTGVLVVAAIATLIVTRPPMVIPEHASLQGFPLRIGAWEGQEVPVDPIMVEAAQVSDSFAGVYFRPPDSSPVQVWIAFYDSQVRGAAVHSPQACLPGEGWIIEGLEERVIPNVRADGGSLRVNRVIIALGEQRQIVYYWFPQRGRNITSELLVKWFILWDGIRLNRSDGALVRITTPAAEPNLMPEADRRLEAFIRDVDPKLNYHLPGATAPARGATPGSTLGTSLGSSLDPVPGG